MQAHMVIVERLGKVDLGMLRQRVRFRHDQHQLVLPVGQGLHASAAVHQIADAQIGRAILHRTHDVRAQMLFQVDLDVFMCTRKAAQILGQELHDGRNARMHAHMAAYAFGIFAQLVLHFVDTTQYGARMVQQVLAGWREGDAPCVAFQQGGMEQRLQIAQSLADGRGGNIGLVRRAPDAAGLAHGNKELQRSQVKTAGNGVVSGHGMR